MTVEFKGKSNGRKFDQTFNFRIFTKEIQRFSVEDNKMRVIDDKDLETLNKSLMVFKGMYMALRRLHSKGYVHRGVEKKCFYWDDSIIEVMDCRHTGPFVKRTDVWEDFYDLVMNCVMWCGMTKDWLMGIVNILQDIEDSESFPALAIKIWADELGIRKEIDAMIK